MQMDENQTQLKETVMHSTVLTDVEPTFFFKQTHLQLKYRYLFQKRGNNHAAE